MRSLKETIRLMLALPQLATLSTITEDGLPWSRYVMIKGDDELTIRCATRMTARKVAQIKKNPNVHINCGVTGLSMKPYLQIQGVATVSTDESERRAFWNPAIATIFDGPDDPDYGVIVIRAARIEYCRPPSIEPMIWFNENRT